MAIEATDSGEYRGGDSVAVPGLVVDGVFATNRLVAAGGVCSGGMGRANRFPPWTPAPILNAGTLPVFYTGRFCSAGQRDTLPTRQ